MKKIVEVTLELHRKQHTPYKSFYWIMRANGEFIAKSTVYTTKAELKRTLADVIGFIAADNFTVVDCTRK